MIFHNRVGIVLFVLGVLFCTGGILAQPVSGATGVDGATFNITWSSNCETPPEEAITALDYAAGLWGTWVTSTVPVEVTACWTTNLICSGDALACGGPTEYLSNFSGAPLLDTYYPVALANALNGSDLKPGGDDIILHFKADVTWSFVTTATHVTTPANNEDFVTVALHEIAHGLGFVGNMYEDYSIGFCGNGPYGFLYPGPTIYDRFVVDSEGVPLLNYLTPDPRELGTRLKKDAHFGGLNTIATNGGTAAMLYTPGIWQWGSSLSHLDHNTFMGGENRLMTPAYSGLSHHPGPVTLAIFQDMGWLRTDGVPNVIISGTKTANTGHTVTFTGDIFWPGYTGQPLTYTWDIEGQEPITHTGVTGADYITRTWPTAGKKGVRLTVIDSEKNTASSIRDVVVTNRIFLPVVLLNN